MNSLLQMLVLELLEVEVEVEVPPLELVLAVAAGEGCAVSGRQAQQTGDSTEAALAADSRRGFLRAFPVRMRHSQPAGCSVHAAACQLPW